MDWKTFDAVKWVEGMRVRSVAGVEWAVIYRCADAYSDLLAVESLNGEHSATLSFRDIAEVK